MYGVRCETASRILDIMSVGQEQPRHAATKPYYSAEACVHESLHMRLRLLVLTAGVSILGRYQGIYQ